MKAEKQTIRIAHSPDSDDAFMFYGLAKGKIASEEFVFEHILKDIESLNQMAMEGVYEVSAISFHAYAYVNQKYILMPCGASIGRGYGPILIAKRGSSKKDWRQSRIAVPGKWTTAYLALRLYQGDFKEEIYPFDQIMEAVLKEEVDAGLIIHEGQLTYGKQELEKIVDLGEWWQEKNGLPLPLGGNVIRRDLGSGTIQKVAGLIKRSILYSLENRKEALEYAGGFSRGLEKEEIDRFVGMYVNEETITYSAAAKQSIELLLKEGYEKGWIPNLIRPEFAELKTME